MSKYHPMKRSIRIKDRPHYIAPTENITIDTFDLSFFGEGFSIDDNTNIEFDLIHDMDDDHLFDNVPVPFYNDYDLHPFARNHSFILDRHIPMKSCFT